MRRMAVVARQATFEKCLEEALSHRRDRVGWKHEATGGAYVCLLFIS